MRICIFGAGAVGGVIAAWLSRAGYDVPVVARGAHLTAIRERGLRIRSATNGEITVTRPRAESDPAKFGPQDCVIVTVKGPSLPEVAASIGPLLAPHTSIVTAMNGVPWWFFDRLSFADRNRPEDNSKPRLESLDPSGALRRAMPSERIVGCVIHLAASILEPGLISHTMGSRLILGGPGGNNTERVRRIAAALEKAGFEIVVSPAIEREFWIKLLGNVSFNPVSALTLATADRLIADDQVKAYMVAIMRECLDIGRAVGVDAEIEPEARIDMARKLGNFKTSMLQDLEAGKVLEIDTLLTGTLEVARKAGVRAPYTESLLGMIRLRADSTGQYVR